MAFNLDDYVDVKTRIQLFWDKYPNGRIETSEPMPVPGRPDMIYMRAKVFAERDDINPIATGTAAELVNGKTPYTKDSEVMNLETSVIGRCIGNANIGISKGMASLNEVIRAEELKAQASAPAPKSKPVAHVPEPAPVAHVQEVDPWTGQPIPEQQLAIEAMQCKHGNMTWKEGIGKTGKPYSGWVCTVPKDEGQCPAQWN